MISVRTDLNELEMLTQKNYEIAYNYLKTKSSETLLGSMLKSARNGVANAAGSAERVLRPKHL